MTTVAVDEWIENARMIVESARAIVPADGSLDRVRAMRFREPGFDRAMMKQAAELGLFLMRVEEQAGGLGLGMRETCELMRVLGRGLVPEPIQSSMMACALLQSDIPETVLAGDAVIVSAFDDHNTAWVGLEAGDGGRLNGKCRHVPGAAGADYFAVVVDDGVVLVHRNAEGLLVELSEMIDGCYAGNLTFTNVEGQFFRSDGINRVSEDARLAHSAYLLGVCERAFELTLDYLRIREQFGKPIGSFQSLQHRATEMKIQMELSRAGIFATARRFDAGADDKTRSQGAARCKLRASTLTMLIAREAIQMHGAMGITDEADIGLFIRKGMADANLYGSARDQKQLLTGMLDEVAA